MANGIPNLCQRLTTEKELTVAYLGGSITQGAGASSPEKTSWRALTTAWLRGRCPGVPVREVNAGIGGTASDFGVFRCGEVLANRPDLVFVEFVVNDCDRPFRTLRCLEGIVRQIRRQNERTDLVFVETVTKELAEKYYDFGELFPSIAETRRVARYYGIPEIDVGRVLWQQIAAGCGTWETMTTDGTHPTDRGHALYAAQVRNWMENQLDLPVGESGRPLPKLLCSNPLENVHMVAAGQLAGPEWRRETDTCWGGTREIVSSNRPGEEIAFSFEGDTVGASWIMDADSGRIECTVDDRPPEVFSAFDSYCLQFRRLHYFLVDSLPAGTHRVVFRILPESDTRSKNTWIRFHTLFWG